jgi:hypothetical protein
MLPEEVRDAFERATFYTLRHALGVNYTLWQDCFQYQASTGAAWDWLIWLDRVARIPASLRHCVHAVIVLQNDDHRLFCQWVSSRSPAEILWLLAELDVMTDTPMEAIDYLEALRFVISDHHVERLRVRGSVARPTKKENNTWTLSIP